MLTQLLDRNIVETVVTGDDVSRLKPDPEAYLRALQQLDVPAQNALAVEDSELGLKAAVAAKLATIVVTTDYTADQDFAGAAMVRSSFAGTEPLMASTCRRVHRLWWAATKAEAARNDTV